MDPEEENFMRLFLEKMPNPSPPPQLELETDSLIENSAMLGGQKMPNLQCQEAEMHGATSATTDIFGEMIKAETQSFLDNYFSSAETSVNLSQLLDVAFDQQAASTEPILMSPSVMMPNPSMASVLQPLIPAQPGPKPFCRRGPVKDYLKAARDGTSTRGAGGGLSNDEIREMTELEAFAQSSKKNRETFGLSQTDTVFALNQRYQAGFGNGTISNFEHLILNLENMRELRGMLEQWEEDVKKALAQGATKNDLKKFIKSSMKSNGADLVAAKTHPALLNILAIKGRAMKIRRSKKFFNLRQRRVLFAHFNTNHWPMPKKVSEIAKELNVSRKTIQHWFHHQRRRWREAAIKSSEKYQKAEASPPPLFSDN